MPTMVFLKRFPVFLLFLYAESFQHNLAFLSKYQYNPSPSTSRRWSIEDIPSKETDAAAAGPISEEEIIAAAIAEENTIGEDRNGDTSVIKNGYTMNSNVNGYSMTSGYSPFLDQEPSPKWLRKIIVKRSESSRDDMDEDGYAEMQRGRNQSLLKRIVKFPLKAVKSVVSKDTKEPGTLILVRHGESSWNRNKTFTGWSDPGE